MVGHSIIGENREVLTITAVKDVSRFNEENISLALEEGGLEIDGTALQVVHLNLDEGKVVVDGTVNRITYTQKKNKAEGSILKRLLK